MIWIRADANQEIGAGHVMRCLSIATRLQKCGQEVLFILADDGAAALLSARGQKYIVLHTDYSRPEDELGLFCPMLSEEKPELLLIDSYFVTPCYVREVGKYTRTVYMDDKFSFPCPADGVINYNIYGELLPYREEAQDKSRKFFLGCSYAPLRDEFQAISYQVEEKAEDVLITTGGSDKYNLAGKILRCALLDGEGGKLQYHVVSGSFNSNLPELTAVSQKHANVHIYQDVRNMAELMKQCDIAVTAGGSTMYELCAVGVPIICFSFVDNQERIVETFVDKGLVCYGGNYLKEKDELPKRVVEHIRLLAESKALREGYSRREKKLVDGRGAERIAQELIGIACENVKI